MNKILLMIGISFLLTNCTIVGPGERAVRYNFGSVSNDVLKSGTHLWIPYFVGSKTINVLVHPIEIKTSSGTKDQQEITTNVVVNLQVNPDRVVDIVTEFGDEDDALERIVPLIQESVNANISKYSAQDVLTERNRLKTDIEAMVKEKVTKYGFIVHDISVKDLQYSVEYSKAIEAKQIAEQQAKQAEYETQKAVQTAKAEVERAKGASEAQRLQKTSITSELLQKMAIEKWNGNFPQVMGTGTLPFLNIDTLKSR